MTKIGIFLRTLETAGNRSLLFAKPSCGPWTTSRSTRNSYRKSASPQIAIVSPPTAAVKG